MSGRPKWRCRVSSRKRVIPMILLPSGFVRAQRAAFGEQDAPRTLLGVSVLGYDDQLLEVDAIAVRPQPSN